MALWRFNGRDQRTEVRKLLSTLNAEKEKV
jgi:hypothetical protein